MGFSCRNVVLNCGALRPLLNLLEKRNIPSFLRIGIWTLTNIFEGGPKAPFEQDEAVLIEACWASLNLSKCGGGIDTAMYEADLCFKLADLFKHSPLSVLFPATRAITTILRGTLDKRTFSIHTRVMYEDRDDSVVSFEKRSDVVLANLRRELEFYGEWMR